MFQAMGRGVQRNRDGSFTTKVEFVDTRTGRAVRVDSIVAGTLDELKSKIAFELQSLKEAEHDVALTTAIVDVILGEI